MKKSYPPIAQSTSGKPTQRKDTRLLLFQFSLMAIGLLFAGLLFGFLFGTSAKDVAGWKMPVVFHVNTLLLIISSYTIHQAWIAIQDENTRRYNLAMLLTFGLGISFMWFQWVGWQELSEQGIYIKSFPSGSYLYLVSGLHALHFIVGIIAVGICVWKGFQRQFNPVKELLFYTDKSAHLSRIHLIIRYWHFVDVLWAILFLFFMIKLDWGLW